MTRSEFIFNVIDKIFHPIQNYRQYKGMVRESDFVYDENFIEDCRGDYYYLPEVLKNEKKLPIILNIHGGGFVKGDKKHRMSLCSDYASRGYFVFNINYRLSPKYKFPSGVQDCVKAINHLKTIEEKYNLDLEKVIITGDSAGAYYATMVVAVTHDETLRNTLQCDEVIVKPALLASFCGPYDLAASISLTKLPFDLVWDMGHCMFDDDTFQLKKDFSNINDIKLLKESSPTNWVNKDWCPSFLVMAAQDIFCKGQGELLEEKLIEAGVPVDTYKSSKIYDNHCFHLDMYKSISHDCFVKVFEFIDKFIEK